MTSLGLIIMIIMAVSHSLRPLPGIDGMRVFPFPRGWPFVQTVGLTFSVRKIGENVTNDDYDEYLTRLNTFRTWFDKTIMSLSSKSDDIMVLPAGIAAQNYRDEPPRYVGDATLELFIGELLGPPWLRLYHSEILTTSQ